MWVPNRSALTHQLNGLVAHGRRPLTVRGCETRGVRGSSDRRGSLGVAIATCVAQRVKFLEWAYDTFLAENTVSLGEWDLPREVGAESVIVIVGFDVDAVVGMDGGWFCPQITSFRHPNVLAQLGTRISKRTMPVSVRRVAMKHSFQYSVAVSLCRCVAPPRAAP